MRKGAIETKSTEWWRSTSQHMWRTYFAIRAAIQKTGVKPGRGASGTVYGICERIFNERFTKADQDILQMYYTTRWGDDLFAVEDYASKRGLHPSVVWMVVRRANRMVVEERGILDRKRGDDE